ncbi:putative selenate reductase subunit YgfK [Moorella sulfitireducens (nom. illeg.)]|uniref:putative selenate reductase subunit YgfK n=1 Tax=Neomoorella sulfitireducens TaxID=2972948 RepID=UPI0021AC91FE|nr:putative selenate reductase subunit YgfK [Moorella sulfitireducens]
MGSVMRPISFRDLLTWIIEERYKHNSVFGIPQAKFFQKKTNTSLQLFGEYLDTPIGPAAGPHTQLAQNIVASYLCGGRFFELKTVQVLDRLDIPKPCIDAGDECYNVEWSTELTVEEAFAEYVKAWFLLHVIQKELWDAEQRGFIFNMSVGYDLQGIKSPKVDKFIEGLKDASRTSIFQECKAVLKEEIKKFTRVDEGFIDSISPNICQSVTLSTMHGCPPGEIETICRHLLAQKKLHTFVKLNPTLLGYEFVKEALAGMGYGYIQLKEESFSHDLQYDDGLALLKRLQGFAREHGRGFGVKLSNTLAVKNNRGALPGEEMYLSGRALYPLTINLAARLAAEFAGQLKISYAGGGDVFNVPQIFATGIWPLTVATTLLKPGGYLRLKQLAGTLETQVQDGEASAVDVEKLAGLAAASLKHPDYLKEKRGTGSRKVGKKLPLTNCFIAPCTAGCPVGQDVPEYIRLVGEKRYLDAYELIITKNPLPFITGSLCPQFCAEKCTRLDYDEPVCIREVKKLAAARGGAHRLQNRGARERKDLARVAVIGAGPSGLAAGYFLARAGLDVTVFDRREKPGGTVQYIIPPFRISGEAINGDLELIKGAGVTFKLGADPGFSVAGLQRQGYKYIYLAIGAGKAKALSLKAGEEKVVNAVDFLEQFKDGRVSVQLGKRVAVIGGGDVAMDAARAALRVAGVEKVYIIYRRTREYMPARREELKAALAEGITLKELLAPHSWSGGVLQCQKMRPGEPDASGRPGVVPLAGEFENIPVDAVISAIGQEVDYHFLQKNGIEINAPGQIAIDPATNETNIKNVFLGGDALRGPATIVEAIADGGRVARAILAREGIGLPTCNPGNYFEERERLRQINLKKGILRAPGSHPEKENERCLECGFACNICTEVCPNRANIAVEAAGSSLRQVNQVIHVDGMCNECGNCATFCPYDGAPYKDKLTLFWREDDFDNSRNDGFLLLSGGEKPLFKLRIDGRIYRVAFDASGTAADVGVDRGILDLVWAVFRGYRHLFCGAHAAGRL